MANIHIQPLKVLVVGDNGIGKTSVLLSYVTNKCDEPLPKEYISTTGPLHMVSNAPPHSALFKLNFFDSHHGTSRM
jgi:GTPase SAR1 family protein